MTATPLPTPPTPRVQRPRPNRSGLWTFFRLLGGWVSVAALAYLMWVPNKDWGWPTLLFGWVLLTLVADEFGGWFGYIALALGVLPLLHGTPPEQWFAIFPLVAGALFAALLVKHSGGPLVVPFAALLFAGTLLAGEKLGIKMKVPMSLLSNPEFRRVTLMPMAAVMGFSFVRQLILQLLAWQKARRARVLAAIPPLVVPQAVQTPSPADMAHNTAPANTVPVSSSPGSPEQPSEQVTDPAEVTILSAKTPAPVVGPAPTSPTIQNPTIIDFDLSGEPGEVTPPKQG